MSEGRTVQIGDRVRCSVELLVHLYELPAHRSVLVDVVDIRAESDGSKTLVFRRVDETVGCDCEEAGNPDLQYHASDCVWRIAQEGPR